ncbi:MAG: N-acetylmuramoyl-L-alanine amidase [Phycisphaeraceae bacterium]|nr:N-acetylmuramoyl-L-alanine amidase [Phycisphaeraceae bacterium]
MKNRRTLITLLLLIAGCTATPTLAPRPTAYQAPTPPISSDSGDQIVICGRRYSIGAPVVLWTDPQGFNAYRGGHFNDRVTRDEPNHEPPGFEQLQGMVDQFVIHYDAAGTSPRCFSILEKRGLSVQFMLDIDGTIYQTMDLQHRAWHASEANSRSIGVEIANLGAFRDINTPLFEKWYTRDMFGVRLTPPPGRIYPTLRPARPYPVQGEIQHRLLTQYDYTDAQYESLSHLTAALSRIFPKLELAWPQQDYVLSPQQFEQWHGLLGHHHITTSKVDPGPAFDWQRVIRRAKELR